MKNNLMHKTHIYQLNETVEIGQLSKEVEIVWKVGGYEVGFREHVKMRQLQIDHNRKCTEDHSNKFAGIRAVE